MRSITRILIIGRLKPLKLKISSKVFLLRLSWKRIKVFRGRKIKGNSSIPIWMARPAPTSTNKTKNSNFSTTALQAWFSTGFNP